MSYNGSGTFQINTTGQPVVAGTVISSTAFNALTADLANGLSTAITKDGQTTITNNIPFGNNKITGLAVATASGDALSYGQAATVAALTATSISDSGNLTFTGTGNRITGDFTNATLSNRVAFQTSTVNGATNVFAIPNGTGTTAGFFANNDSALTNGSEAQLFANGTTDVRISSAIRGTGTYLPMTFYTNGSERMRIDTSGNVGIGTTSIESFGGGHKTLEVAGSTNTEGGVFKTTTSGSAGSGSTGTEMLMFTDSVGGKINVVSSHPAIFYTSNAERMRIDSSGNVGIGTTANASAILDAQSTTKGVRFPNMTTTQKNAVSSPAAGLVVFDTTLSKLCVYSGAAWQTITSV